MPALKFKHLRHQEIASHLDALAGLRIRVFREWPYLYDGNLQYEREYLQTYVDSMRSLAFLVFDGGDVVGATTALPLADEEAEFRQPLAQAGYDPEKMFYFGESLLLPEYRGCGLGHRFFDEREAWARHLGGYSHTCFCAVQRPDNHPARRAGYRPLHAFWENRGYRRRDSVTARYRWQDVGDNDETYKTLVFWIRELAA